jgi:uncharacterized protein
MKKVNFNINFNESIDDFIKLNYPDFEKYIIHSESLDARGAKKGRTPNFNYHVTLFKNTIQYHEYLESKKESFSTSYQSGSSPIIIGAGPAGLFSALRFEEYGIKTIILERGDRVNSRMLKISNFWKNGVLCEDNNVCFGAGGAGLFSDGKLVTRIKSPYVKYVMKKLIEFGADKKIEYISNPHVGSNNIRKIIVKIIDYLQERGHQIHFNSKVDDFVVEQNKNKNEKDILKGVILSDKRVIESNVVILATGHSAKNIYTKLNEYKVKMKPKDFSVGVRIEHPRALIDQSQHGQFNEELDSARYSLKYFRPLTSKGTYSFCMCPGGYVLSSGTEKNSIVTNGMSNSKRNSKWSNSAIVVEVNSDKDLNVKEDLLAGIKFQENIEKNAFEVSKRYASGKELPGLTLKEFLTGKLNNKKMMPVTSSPSGIFKTDLKDILPNFVTEHLKEALTKFSTKIEGYGFNDAVIFAPETRTSSPVTIERDMLYESVSHKCLYPCGEGAGYAGGITSAAVDGIKIVESILG